MRKVEIISNKYVNGVLTTKVKGRGVFHKWTTDYEELENGVGIYPAAIIEKSDGQITVEYAGSVRFLDA